MICLYPPTAQRAPLAGLYLADDLRATESARPHFVYSNFIMSLDGRISLPDPATGRRQVPPAIANERDWRLYMELLAQADVLVTTTRHLRAVAAGRHGNLLRIAEVEYPDIVAWRRARGLPPYPICVAASTTLDLPAEALRACHEGPVEIVTTDRAAPERVHALERAGIRVLRAGRGERVEGSALIDALVRRGHRFIYSIAGPQLFHALLAADRVHRLYLTVALAALGGERYDTLTRGPAFAPAVRFALRRLYLDATPGGGQLFASLDRKRS